MSENATEVFVGGAVLAVAIGFLVYAGQATGLSSDGDGYPLTASFRSVEGVSVGTDIRLAGVKIGTVTGLELNSETYRADTVMHIHDGILIPDDSLAQVSSEGLLGGTYMEIVPGGSFENLETGGEIVDTQGAVGLISLLTKFVSGGSDSE